jgi:sigma-B regulation protein RsbU (phosphoserine phosphatase)
MVLGKYWPLTGKVQFARAGHSYPLWIVNHGFRELSRLDGIPVGVKFETEYEKAEFVISPGDAIILIADGVTEAENKKSELFDDDRLTDYFKGANGPPWANGLLDRIDSWRGKAVMIDDLTILEIWRDPPR